MLLLLALPAAAEAPPDQKLRQVEKQLEQSRQRQEKLAKKADALADELATLRADSVAAARTAQEHEAALSELEDQLAALAAEERTKSADLRRRQAQQTALMMALQRLSRHPPEALAFGPGEPVDALRSAALLAGAVPRLAAEAKTLRDALAGVAELRRRMAEKRDQVAGRQKALEKERVRLAALIARKAVVQGRAAHGAETSAARLQLLSAQANDLRELIERLEAERKRREEEERRQQAEEQRRQHDLLARAMAARPQPPAAPHAGEPASEAGSAPAGAGPAAAEAPRRAGPHTVAAATVPRLDATRPKGLRNFVAGRTPLTLPVSGRIARRYGEANDLGQTTHGLLLETRPGAQVVAPFDGRIMFAGPFRGYGQILIIEHGGGYHSLLAGLERIDGVVGQWLVAGEPVAAMTAGEAKPRLYLELRRDGQPINPLPFLATREDKGTG